MTRPDLPQGLLSVTGDQEYPYHTRSRGPGIEIGKTIRAPVKALQSTRTNEGSDEKNACSYRYSLFVIPGAGGVSLSPDGCDAGKMRKKGKK